MIIEIEIENFSASLEKIFKKNSNNFVKSPNHPEKFKISTYL